ncbi:apolipoprotein A1/A4/E family protein [Nocardioides panacis]|uniref:Apolipoprotein A1/A4/E family protein n=1 Tax=Nocardioides panacis TaxID=2849501 RepID=A0A975SXF9_9ACTN|nr:apolipoprotein A1/A4/E family protein [Nocardioides panacis]QWZ07661.1 apolipoprotein A1/A4/E family protein [Nocardioides panacis]
MIDRGTGISTWTDQQTRTADLRREDLATMIGKKKTLREQILDQASDLADSARDKAGPVLADARDRAVPVLADARDKAAPVLADARAKAAPYVSEARDKAAPYLSDAKGKAAPYVSDARDKFSDTILPVLTAALASVEEATEEARGESKRRGKAVAAALKGEIEAPQPKHRGRKLLVLVGLGGIAFAAYKKFGAKQPTTNWQSSYTPPPAPAPTATGGPVGATGAGAHRADADDVAASTPGEAASDATDVPHDATTPDNPVTEIDVENK